jgi:RNA 2',3'-cyclic 3'-phosphodiesterase
MRCFVAVELPAHVRHRLADLQSRMADLGRAVRWTRPESIHLTLKFLGEVPDAQVSRICTTAREIAAKYPVCDLELAGTGCFPPRGPVRVVWIGISQPPPPLLECQRDCESAYATLGFEPENRPYSPHLTIGRVNDPAAANRIRSGLQQFESFSAGRFTADGLTVFQSQLRPAGSIYTPLARAPFKPL